MSKLLVVCAIGSSLAALGLLGALRSAASAPGMSRAQSAALTDRVSTPAAAAPLEPSTTQASNVVVLEELHIVGRRAPRRPVPVVPKPDAELVPCSEWRAIGPVFSARVGEAARERHVQLLCRRDARRSAR